MSKLKLLGWSLLFCALGADFVLADPPGWAPAHGWRKKHEREHDADQYERKHKHKRKRDRDERRVGYEGRQWPSDYGILRSQCDRERVGAVLGGVVGGVIGSRAGNEEDRVIATVIGAVVGAVIGAQVGRVMDERDRACVGHALELADSGRAVHWTNEETGTAFLLSPLSDYEQGGRSCREFSLEVTAGNKRDVSRQKACRGNDGVWAMQSR
jgi:surface antigen